MSVRIKRTERGWAAHFCCSDRCLFRRNTLLEKGNERIIISTVGAFFNKRGDDDFLIELGYTETGDPRYYETAAFKAMKEGAYWEIDAENELNVEGKWQINEMNEDSDLLANKMHEDIVNEFIKKLS